MLEKLNGRLKRPVIVEAVNKDRRSRAPSVESADVHLG
jgi:hypothetical protein